MTSFLRDKQRGRQFISGEKERAEKILQLSTTLAKDSSEYINRLDFIERSISYSEDYIADEMIQSGEKLVGGYMKTSLGILDSAVEKLCAINPNLDFVADFPDDIEAVHHQEFVRPFIGIRAELINKKIVVWLPHLTKKHQRISASTSKNPYPYSHAYADEVSYELRKLTAFFTSQQFNDFATKTLNFYHCYSKRSKHLPDTDNYDTKTVVDAISGWLPYGDQALACSFFSQTVVRDDVKPGTYVVVTSGLSPTVFEANLPEITKINRLIFMQKSG